MTRQGIEVPVAQFFLSKLIKSQTVVKSKTSLYILLPVVLIIWGLLIWRIVGAFSEEVYSLPPAPITLSSPHNIILKDTFSLLEVDRDPFLNISYKKQGPIKKSAVVKTKEVEWPSISYLGLVTETGVSSGIHIVKINEQQFLLKPGNEAEGVKLLRTNGNTVSLAYRGTRKEFKKDN